MKRITVLSMAFTILLLLGCNQDEAIETEAKVLPITLSKRVLRVGPGIPRDGFKILSGNENYSFELSHMLIEGDVPAKYFDIFLKEDSVIVEYNGTDITNKMTASYYLVDGAGVKKSFVVKDQWLIWMPEFND